MIERRFKHLRGPRGFLRRRHRAAAARASTTRRKLSAAASPARSPTPACALARARRADRRRRRRRHAAAGCSSCSRPALRGRPAAAYVGLRAVAARRPLLAVAIAAGVPLTARKAWRALALGVARHQRADAGRRRRRGRLGQWSEAATVVFLFAVAQMLEARSIDRARHAIRALMDLTPADALFRDGTASAACRRAGRAGRGHRRASGREDPARRRRRRRRRATSTRRRSPASRCRWTRRPGDEVFAGTINGRGALEVRSPGCAATRRWRGSSTWSSARRPSARPRRRSSIASRASTRRRSSRWRRWSRSCRRCRRAPAGDLDLPRAGAAGRSPARARS